MKLMLQLHEPRKCPERKCAQESPAKQQQNFKVIKRQSREHLQEYQECVQRHVSESPEWSPCPASCEWRRRKL